MTKLFLITLALLNFLFVIFMAVAIANSTDPVAVNAWLVFIPLDFPVSMGLFPVGYIFDGDQILNSINEAGEYSIYRDIDNFILGYWVLYSGIKYLNLFATSQAGSVLVERFNKSLKSDAASGAA